MLNIIGGSKKKAKLNVPIINVRPTSSKKREAIFSIIENKILKNRNNIYSNGYFLDLFAGSGSLGLEAISRGAKYCYFYEIAKEVIETLESNCLKICEYNNYKKISAKIEKFQNPYTWVIFKLKEGKNREIRNICKFFKWNIIKLIRIQYGTIKLSKQKMGEIQEVKKLPAKLC